MKRVLCFALSVCLVFSGCGNNGDVQNIDIPQDAKSIVDSLVDAAYPIDNIIVYTEETDTNNLLGRPGGYLSKVSFADTRCEQYDSDSPVGGTVEVFDKKADCDKRKEYIEEIAESMPMFQQYIYQYDNALVRFDTELTPSQAEEYNKALAALFSGEEIAPYIAAISPIPIITAPDPVEPVDTPYEEPVAAPTPSIPPPPIATGVVKGEEVNMRSGPGTDYDIVQKISQPAVVELWEQHGDWYAVTVAGVAGYLRQDFITMDGQDAAAKAPEGTPIAQSAPVPEPAPGPSQSSGGTVYWVPNGGVYHSTPNCSTLSNSDTVLSGAISESGKPRGCKRCH